MPTTFLRYFCTLLAATLTYSASSQIRPAPTTPQPLRKASQLIQKQGPIKINHSLMQQATPDSVHVVISLPKQRAYLMVGEQIVIDSPISSGKRGHTSPTGHLPVLEKDPKRDPLCGRDHEMVHATDRRRCRHAHRNSARISRLARLYSNATWWSEVILRSSKGRYAG